MLWLEDNQDTIDWEKLGEWADEHEDEEGYEWIEEARQQW